MKTLIGAALLLSFSLPGLPPAPAARKPMPIAATQPIKPAHKGGRWYFAENGHAVYCYGPVVTLTQIDGGLQRVATFCQGDQKLVPLKD
jgi:hypothetical protein